MKLYFQNLATGKVYEVTKLDGDKIYLKGEHGEFDLDYNKEQFQRMGYTLVKQEETVHTETPNTE